jgi:hypothetical protein
VKFLSAVVLLVIFSFFGELLAQELYRWMDDRGIVHFADIFIQYPKNIGARPRRDSLRTQAIISPDRQRDGRRLFDRLILPHENG